MIQIPNFENKENLFDWLIENKSALIAQKKSAVKFADAVRYTAPLVNDKGEVCKAEANVSPDATKIKVRSIINTTKIMDSHDDVHIDQLWNKSLKENKDNYLVQEHNFCFAGIISSDVKAFVKQMTWKELGFDFEGQTQALIFDSIIETDKETCDGNGGEVNMADEYIDGNVKNHSVGMRYVTLFLCVNDDRYDAEFANWNKYIGQVVNADAAIEQGYFWAVTEAKLIEGSAVVRGSNYVTPTQSVEETKVAGIATTENIEPAAATQKQSIFSQLILQK